MKLLHIYNIVNDEKFLVELVDDELTLVALQAVVQDRVKNVSNSFSGLLYNSSVDISANIQRLVFKNSELRPGNLPDELFRDSQESIHVVPFDLDPSIPYTVIVNVSPPNLPFVVKCANLKKKVTRIRYQTNRGSWIA